MEEKKMKFHITITNNETGETLEDADACAILASINIGDKVSSLQAVSCGPEDYARTLGSAEGIVRAVRSKHPEIGALSLVFGLISKTKETEEPENKQAEAQEKEESPNQ